MNQKAYVLTVTATPKPNSALQTAAASNINFRFISQTIKYNTVCQSNSIGIGNFTLFKQTEFVLLD